MDTLLNDYFILRNVLPIKHTKTISKREKIISKNNCVLNQNEISTLLFIKKYIEINNYSPSYKEISKLQNVPFATIQNRIYKFVNLGYLIHNFGEKRALKINQEKIEEICKYLII